VKNTIHRLFSSLHHHSTTSTRNYSNKQTQSSRCSSHSPLSLALLSSPPALRYLSRAQQHSLLGTATSAAEPRTALDMSIRTSHPRHASSLKPVRTASRWTTPSVQAAPVSLRNDRTNPPLTFETVRLYASSDCTGSGPTFPGDRFCKPIPANERTSYQVVC
jgi:hypothetical protein